MPKLIQERWKCIGCGACVAMSSEFWDMAADGKSKMKIKHTTNKGKDGEIDEGEITAEQVAPNEEAVNVCPVSCIKIEK